MKKIFLSIVVIVFSIISLTSCYNNKTDILSLPTVSFVDEIVPIMTSGACGCHNSLGRARGNSWVQFTDTLTGKPNYDAILARAEVMNKWAKGTVSHPGGGDVELTERDKITIMNWFEQGAKSDVNDGGSIPTTVTYTANIAPLIKNSCSGGSCHGGAGPTFTYATLTSSSNITHLTQMANSGGASGHPGGKLTLSSTVSKLILNWITQGTKQ